MFTHWNACKKTTVPLNNIKNEGAKALADVLKTNTTLLTLNLDHRYIFTLLLYAYHEGMLSLFVTRNSIEDEGAISIGRALKENSTLTKLYIANNTYQKHSKKE